MSAGLVVVYVYVCGVCVCVVCVCGGVCVLVCVALDSGLSVCMVTHPALVMLTHCKHVQKVPKESAFSKHVLSSR